MILFEISILFAVCLRFRIKMGLVIDIPESIKRRVIDLYWHGKNKCYIVSYSQ